MGGAGSDSVAGALLNALQDYTHEPVLIGQQREHRAAEQRAQNQQDDCCEPQDFHFLTAQVRAGAGQA